MSEAVAAFVGAILAAAGLQKLFGGWKGFEAVVDAYALLPVFAVPVVARVVPVAEILLGIGLAFGLAPVLFASGSSLMLFSFAIAVTVNLLRGVTDISCGCFGHRDDDRLTWFTAMRATGLGLLAAAIPLLPSISAGSATAGVSRAAAIAVGVTGVGVVFLYQASKQISSFNASTAADLFGDDGTTRGDG